MPSLTDVDGKVNGIDTRYRQRNRYILSLESIKLVSYAGDKGSLHLLAIPSPDL